MMIAGAWRPLDRLAVVASIVFVTDFSSKQWALRHLGSNGSSLVTGWHLAIVNNTHLGWGLGGDGSALWVTLALTLAIAVLVFRISLPLAEIDAGAPTMLGLLVGAGAANLADASMPPQGVVDFIAFTNPQGLTTSFNIADIVLAVGLCLSLRSMWRIITAMRGRTIHKPAEHRPFRSGAIPVRDRILVSSGHALMAMCAFIWLYSMALAWTPDAGRSAPNSLLCGVGVFALAFIASRARMRLLEDRTPITDLAITSRRFVERVVLDGSVAAGPTSGDAIEREPARRPPAPLPDEQLQGRVDGGPSA